MNARTCPECGSRFRPTRNTQVCCGAECQKQRTGRLRKLWNSMNQGRAGVERVRREAREAAARRRAAFFAARDEAFARIGLPPPRIEVRDGVAVERRGRMYDAPPVSDMRLVVRESRLSIRIKRLKG